MNRSPCGGGDAEASVAGAKESRDGTLREPEHSRSLSILVALSKEETIGGGKKVLVGFLS